MEKIKSSFNYLRKNILVKYFLVMAFICIGTIGIIRPILQDYFYTTEVSVTPSKKNLPIYCVNTDEKKVSISFDAAWGADDTEELLKILRDNDVKATFFLCGYWVDDYPEEVKRIHEEGHEIANHSDTHPHGSQLSLEKNKEEILKVHEKIKNLLGVEMDLYRPPFGEYNDTVLQAAKEVGYHTIQWDIDTNETKIEVLKILETSIFFILINPINFNFVIKDIDIINYFMCSFSFKFYVVVSLIRKFRNC